MMQPRPNMPMLAFLLAAVAIAAILGIDFAKRAETIANNDTLAASPDMATNATDAARNQTQRAAEEAKQRLEASDSAAANLGELAPAAGANEAPVEAPKQ